MSLEIVIKMPPHRLIRRQPLAARIKAYLDPLDFLLWVSEQFDSDDWDQWQKDWATPIGLGMNLVMLVARANSGGQGSGEVDDVFGEDYTRTGWLSWFVREIGALKVSKISNTRIVYLCRPHPLTILFYERCIHFLPSTALPTL